MRVRRFVLTCCLAAAAGLRVPAVPTTDRRAALATAAGALAALSHPAALHAEEEEVSAAAPAIKAAAAPAVSAKRFSSEATITPLPPLGALSRYEDELFTAKGSKATSIRISFEFPTQWSQINKALGGIVYVDGSTGLKTYVLQAPLPEGSDLATVPKAWFGQSIFDPEGSIVKGGSSIDEFKVASSKVGDAPENTAGGTRRRLLLKYAVITPANQRLTDRRAFVDAYEVEGVAYMLVASATGSKWEGSEKERCERTADSFRIGGQAPASASDSVVKFGAGVGGFIDSKLPTAPSGKVKDVFDTF